MMEIQQQLDTLITLAAMSLGFLGALVGIEFFKVLRR